MSLERISNSISELNHFVLFSLKQAIFAAQDHQLVTTPVTRNCDAMLKSEKSEVIRKEMMLTWFIVIQCRDQGTGPQNTKEELMLQGKSAC